MSQHFLYFSVVFARNIIKHDIDIARWQRQTHWVWTKKHRFSLWEKSLDEISDSFKTNDFAFIKIVCLNAEAVNKVCHLLIYETWAAFLDHLFYYFLWRVVFSFSSAFLKVGWICRVIHLFFIYLKLFLGFGSTLFSDCLCESFINFSWKIGFRALIIDCVWFWWHWPFLIDYKILRSCVFGLGFRLLWFHGCFLFSSIIWSYFFNIIYFFFSIYLIICHVRPSFFLANAFFVFIIQITSWIQHWGCFNLFNWLVLLSLILFKLYTAIFKLLLPFIMNFFLWKFLTIFSDIFDSLLIFWSKKFLLFWLRLFFVLWMIIGMKHFFMGTVHLLTMGAAWYFLFVGFPFVVLSSFLQFFIILKVLQSFYKIESNVFVVLIFVGFHRAAIIFDFTWRKFSGILNSQFKKFNLSLMFVLNPLLELF